jgi:hypothetical protein
MKRSQFAEGQIIAMLREQEARAKTTQVCRKHGISDTTGCAPWGGVGAVGKWPAAATVKSLAAAGHLSMAVVIADLR